MDIEFKYIGPGARIFNVTNYLQPSCILGTTQRKRNTRENEEREKSPAHGFFFAGTGSQSEFLITDGLALVGGVTPAASITR